MDAEVSIIQPKLNWILGYSGSTQDTAYPVTNPERASSTYAATAFTNAMGLVTPRHAGQVRVWVDLQANTGQSPTVMLDFFGYDYNRSTNRRWGLLARLDASCGAGGAADAAIAVSTTKWSPDANSIIYVWGGFTFGGEFERILVRPTVLTGTISGGSTGLNVYLGFIGGI